MTKVKTSIEPEMQWLQPVPKGGGGEPGEASPELQCLELHSSGDAPSAGKSSTFTYD